MKSTLVTVCGNSMNSLIEAGDIVLSIECNRVRCGDIFIYDYNGNIIIHRVLFVGVKHIWEAGDNNYHIRRVKKVQIVAKVVANVTKNIDLKYSKINRRIAILNLLRCLVGRNITSIKSLINNKRKCKFLLAITKKRNELQLQYKKYTGD